MTSSFSGFDFCCTHERAMFDSWCGLAAWIGNGIECPFRRTQQSLRAPLSFLRLFFFNIWHAFSHAAIAQLGERQTEDLKAPDSIPAVDTARGCSARPFRHANARDARREHMQRRRRAGGRRRLAEEIGFACKDQAEASAV